MENSFAFFFSSESCFLKMDRVNSVSVSISFSSYYDLDTLDRPFFCSFAGAPGGPSSVRISRPFLAEMVPPRGLLLRRETRRRGGRSPRRRRPRLLYPTGTCTSPYLGRLLSLERQRQRRISGKYLPFSLHSRSTKVPLRVHLLRVFSPHLARGISSPPSARPPASFCSPFSRAAFAIQIAFERRRKAASKANSRVYSSRIVERAESGEKLAYCGLGGWLRGGGESLFVCVRCRLVRGCA